MQYDLDSKPVTGLVYWNNSRNDSRIFLEKLGTKCNASILPMISNLGP